MKKIEKILLPLNIILIIAVVVLSVVAMNLQAQIDGAFYSMKNLRDVKLENDLRNRGIIDGELLESEYKPYSLEQMREFKSWAEQQYK